jgi:hypothetical protein
MAQPEQPIKYDTTLNYINIEDVNFSQDSVTIPESKQIFSTLDKIRCFGTPIRIIFVKSSSSSSYDIYIVGFFGEEQNYDKINPNFILPEYFPLIEVVDFETNERDTEPQPYVTINNRRLLLIYMLLYSIAKMNRKYIDEMYSSLSRQNTHELIRNIKDLFRKKQGIIVDNIFIPVIIRNETSNFVTNKNEELSFGNLIRKRLSKQPSFCMTPLVGGLCGTLNSRYQYGADIIPQIGYPVQDNFYLNNKSPQIKRTNSIPSIVKLRSFKSNKKSDYSEMLKLFLLAPEQNMRNKSVVCFTGDANLTHKLNIICKCFHKTFKTNGDTYCNGEISRITPINVGDDEYDEIDKENAFPLPTAKPLSIAIPSSPSSIASSPPSIASSPPSIASSPPSIASSPPSIASSLTWKDAVLKPKPTFEIGGKRKTRKKQRHHIKRKNIGTKKYKKYKKYKKQNKL